MTVLSFLAAILAVVFSTAAPQARENISFTTVFAPAAGDTATVYRIPAIIAAKNGDILAFAEKRMTGVSDNGDIRIVMRRSTDDGLTWGEEKCLWDNKGECFNNPQPVVDDSTGKILMLMNSRPADDPESKVERGESRTPMLVLFATSDDNGETWSELADITASTKPADWTWYTCGPGHAIQIKAGQYKGRIIAGCDHKTYDRQADSVHWFSHCIYTDDLGSTWKVGGTPLPEGGNESTICELSDGRLMMNMRHRGPAGTRRLVSISSDGGDTWSEVTEQKGLIEPCCEGSILNYHPVGSAPSSTLLFSNPRSRVSRNKMSISISRNDGTDWKEYLPVRSDNTGYSDLVNMPDGKSVGIIYEVVGTDPSDYQGITFMYVPDYFIDKTYLWAK
jgi:sialidase-1